VDDLLCEVESGQVTGPRRGAGAAQAELRFRIDLILLLAMHRPSPPRFGSHARSDDGKPMKASTPAINSILYTGKGDSAVA